LISVLGELRVAGGGARKKEEGTFTIDYIALIKVLLE
jgi:hypothetical protein